MTATMRGASSEAVAAVIDRNRPLSGLDGFGGCLPDGRLVRDVLGREPVYRSADGGTWGFDPASVPAPEPVPPGCSIPVNGGTAERQLTLPEPAPVSETNAQHAVSAVIADVLEQLPDIPVAFSGGVDSGLVATGTDGPLYVVGFPDSNDRIAAEEAASAMERPLRTVTLDRDGLESMVPDVARAIGRTDAMSVGIALPLYRLAEAVSSDGYDRLALGQGADELFAGYEKLVSPATDDRVLGETTLEARDEVLGTLPRQIERDVLAIRAGGVEPVFPFLADRVVRAALTLPESQLVSNKRRKVALRDVAATSLPAPIAEREKRALQYGTLVARELDRLAREAGYKRRIGDHVSKYIADQVDGEIPGRETGSDA